MSYLEEIQKQIQKRNFSKFLVLWEEYSANDRVDPDEYLAILEQIKEATFVESFGKIADSGLPLWSIIEDKEKAYAVLRSLVDLQKTDSPALYQETLNVLEERYSSDPEFQDRIKIIGLRTQKDFQGAISNYELLAHFKKGNFVFHKGGWGVGEIMDVSRLREHLLIEFENVAGAKDLSYNNAFKQLTPLPSDHFLARRFGDPDALEAAARKDPVGVVKLLLKDLGPKTAAEIKDEMSVLVIPEEDWTKWWQLARGKLKKDPLIDAPANLKDPFVLRKTEVTDQERVAGALQGVTDLNEQIRAIYSILRDQPSALRNEELKKELQEQLNQVGEEGNTAEKIQVALLLEEFFDAPPSSADLIKGAKDLAGVLHDIDILALRKRALTGVYNHRADWGPLFLDHLLRTHQTMIKDHLLQELLRSEEGEKFEKELEEILHTPTKNPETLVWYFQKIAGKETSSLPYSSPEGQVRFFEAFLILFSQLEPYEAMRPLLKKMEGMLTANRFELVRNLLKQSDVAFAKEFLLLVAKCQSIAEHDKKILTSLAEVAHPSLKRANMGAASLRAHENYLWTTEEGYLKTQERAKHIGTVEVVDNAREIEAARALGDLRENSEYKFALERRSRLQGELKMLSQQLQRARVLSNQDVGTDAVDVGTVVEVTTLQGKKSRYTILGPWDADVEKNILSFQSKLAEAMIGCKKGEKFSFRDEEYEVVGISSFFDQTEK